MQMCKQTRLEANLVLNKNGLLDLEFQCLNCLKLVSFSTYKIDQNIEDKITEFGHGRAAEKTIRKFVIR